MTEIGGKRQSVTYRNNNTNYCDCELFESSIVTAYSTRNSNDHNFLQHNGLIVTAYSTNLVGVLGIVEEEESN